MRVCVCVCSLHGNTPTSGDVMLPAGYKAMLKKQCRSAAGLNQCYGGFMGCAHPISALIKQEQFGNGGSVALKIILLFTRAKRVCTA